MPDGALLSIPSQIICGRTAGPRLVAIAAVHGDELEGVRALQELIRSVDPADIIGTLVVVPVANPPAYLARTRRSPVDGIDLNRVFPGDSDGALSERLAHTICHVLCAGADLVVSLHGLGAYGTLAPWMEFVDIPGPVGHASHAAARASGFCDLIPLPLLPGVLIAALAQRGIPAIEGEIGGQGMVTGANWRTYVQTIHALMRHLGMAAGEPTMATHRYWQLRWAPASAGGLLDRQVELGDAVSAAQTLGVITDMYGEPAGAIIAPCAGLVGGYLTFATVQPGEPAVVLWEPAAPQHAVGSYG
jgi:predicted deacylase